MDLKVDWILITEEFGVWAPQINRKRVKLKVGDIPHRQCVLACVRQWAQFPAQENRTG